MVTPATAIKAACDYAFVAPPKAASFVHCLGRYSSLFCPVGKNHGFTKGAQVDIASMIPVLLRSCFPFAVVFAVSFVVVYALNGVLWGWSLSHVGNEIAKVAPLTADSYSSAAIVGVMLIFLVCASLNHAAPDAVLFTLGLAVSCCFFLVQAATALCKPSSHVVKIYFFFISAVAPEKPSGGVAFARGNLPDGGEHSVLGSGRINSVGWGRHVLSPFALVGVL